MPAIRFVWFCQFRCKKSRICHLFEHYPPRPNRFYCTFFAALTLLYVALLHQAYSIQAHRNRSGWSGYYWTNVLATNRDHGDCLVYFCGGHVYPQYPCTRNTIHKPAMILPDQSETASCCPGDMYIYMAKSTTFIVLSRYKHHQRYKITYVAKEESTSGIRTQHPCLSRTVPYQLGICG